MRSFRDHKAVKSEKLEVKSKNKKGGACGQGPRRGKNGKGSKGAGEG
jgi:hypothetical protein